MYNKRATMNDVSMLNYIERIKGILVPLFYLKTEGDYGIGDFDSLEYLVSNLREYNFIEILPINLPDGSNSPYSPISFYAIDPVYASVKTSLKYFDESKIEWLKSMQIYLHQFNVVDYEKVRNFKLSIYRSLYRIFLDEDKKFRTQEYKDYQDFINVNDFWIQKYSEYMSNHFHEDKEFYMFFQWKLYTQLEDIVSIARSRNVYMCYDIPFYPGKYSIERYTNSDLFSIPVVDGGFYDKSNTKNNQVWHVDVYNFDKEEDISNMFSNRIHFYKRYFDALRIDHFNGYFKRYMFKDDKFEENNIELKNILQIIQKEKDIFYVFESTQLPVATEFIKKIGGSEIFTYLNLSRIIEDTNYREYMDNIMYYSSNHDWGSLMYNNNGKHSEVERIINFIKQKKRYVISLEDILYDSRRLNIPGVINDTNWRIRMLNSISEISL